MKGYFIVTDKGGKTTRVNINGITSKSALGTFVTSFDSFCNGQITEYAVIDAATFAGELQSGIYDSIEQKAKLTFGYTEGTDKKIMRLDLPTPDNDVIEFVNGIGYRVAKAQGDAIAAMLSTLTGRTLTYKRGTYLSKPTQAQV